METFDVELNRPVVGSFPVLKLQDLLRKMTDFPRQNGWAADKKTKYSFADKVSMAKVSAPVRSPAS